MAEQKDIQSLMSASALKKSTLDDSGYTEQEMAIMFSEPPKVILDISDEGVFGDEQPDPSLVPPEPIPPRYRPKPEMVGLVTGSFDILHQGHIGMIRRAKKYCDRLIIAIESDRRVRLAKGKFRPIYHQNQRKKRLERALNDGTQVLILPENFGEETVRVCWLREHRVKLLFTTKKDMHLENKQFLMMTVGGRVEFLPQLMSISTTQLLEGRRAPHYLVFESDRGVVEQYRKKHGEE